MKRIAAIDFGLKRIGIALSDDRQKIAFPLQVVAGGAEAIQNIRKALGDKSVEKILVGLPLLLSGKEGEMATAVKKFATELETALQIPVLCVDERFTSKIADAQLREIRLNRKERTGKMDSAAAALLLQNYLDSLS